MPIGVVSWVGQGICVLDGKLGVHIWKEEGGFEFFSPIGLNGVSIFKTKMYPTRE